MSPRTQRQRHVAPWHAAQFPNTTLWQIVRVQSLPRAVVGGAVDCQSRCHMSALKMRSGMSRLAEA